MNKLIIENEINRLVENSVKRFLKESLEQQDIVDYIKSYGEKGKLLRNDKPLSYYYNPFMKQAYEWFKNNKHVKDEGDAYFDYQWRMTENCFTINSRGLIYVERSMDLMDTNKGDHKSVGECWSWKKGNGDSYCSDYRFSIMSNPDKVTICGYVHPNDVDWLETIYINSYHMKNETEIRMDNDAKVEISYLRINGQKVNLGGSYIINASSDKYNRSKELENEMSWNEFDKQVEQDKETMNNNNHIHDFKNNSINTDKKFKNGALAMDALEDPNGYGASFTDQNHGDWSKWFPFKHKNETTITK